MPAALASWRDGPAKRAILDFVTAAVEDGPGFIPVADRIAAFDNDGTLWVERPLPPQFDFVFRKWAAEAKADPSLAGRQPYKAVIEQDAAFFEGAATQDPDVVETLLEGFARSWAGTTPEEFDAQVREWIRTAEQPQLGVPYVELLYQPMLELLELLKAHEFRVFVCSGGGRDFMRTFAEETWGIYKELVNHDDPEREFAYTKGAERSLAKAERSLAKAERLAWTVVSVKDDWARVFEDDVDQKH